MFNYLNKSIVLITLCCFVNTTILHAETSAYETLSKIEIQKASATAQARGPFSALLFPYYLGKMCIYTYRLCKLKKRDVKGHVKLAKKCREYSEKMGYKVNMERYIDDICQSLEEETGYSLAEAKKDLKKRLKIKHKKGSETDSEEEDDIDFNNVVERRIMEIVETKGEISEEEYIECLRMDPEVDIDSIMSPEKYAETLKEKYLSQDHEHHKYRRKNTSFELSCYITAACVGGFLAMIPIPPINSMGAWLFGTAMVSAGNIIFHEYCERIEQDQESEKKPANKSRKKHTPIQSFGVIDETTCIFAK